MAKIQLIGVGIGGVAFCALMYAGMGTAGAATHLWFGGNTDCTSQSYMNAGGNPNPSDNNVPIAYSTCDGSFAPFLGSTSAPDAIQQGVDAGRAAWDQFCSHGESCTLHGFSVGAAPAAIVGNEVGADAPGSTTHVITEGNAWGAPGVFGGKPGFIGGFINLGAPFAGVPTHIDQVPNSENRLNVNDGWGDNSGQPPWAEITQLSCINGCGDNPPQHYIQTGEPVASFTTNDGVHQEVYGDPFPGVVPPQDNPIVNPELLPAAPPVLADPMDAFQQQMAGLPPCVAPDGGTYFTAAGLGC